MRRTFLALLLVACVTPVARADEITIGQKDKVFSRDAATLKSGDDIKFVNDDTVAHNILVTGPHDETKNSGLQYPGESATLAFDKPGTYDVECAIHPQMKMTVTVK
jgi:plastocyanin